MTIVIYLLIAVSCILLALGGVKKRRSRKTSRPQTAEAQLKEYRRYMAAELPSMLDRYDVFMPAFLSRVSVSFLQGGTTPRFLEEDLKEGTAPDHAAWVLDHCLRICSQRYDNHRAIKNADAAEAKYIILNPHRTVADCPRCPKKKKYRRRDSIPLYPCKDCEEGDFCVVFYNAEF